MRFTFRELPGYPSAWGGPVDGDGQPAQSAGVDRRSPQAFMLTH